MNKLIKIYIIDSTHNFLGVYQDQIQKSFLRKLPFKKLSKAILI